MTDANSLIHDLAEGGCFVDGNQDCQMAIRKIGGGLLGGVSVAVPTVIAMADLQIDTHTAYAILAACAVIFVIAVALIFWPSKISEGSGSSVNVTSNNQSGGITANSVSVNDHGGKKVADNASASGDT